MTKKLFFQAMGKFILGAVAVSLLRFLPAGTLRYWNRWLLMGILFIPMFFASMVMLLRNPGTAEKAAQRQGAAGGTEARDRLARADVLHGGCPGGADFRFGWIIRPVGSPGWGGRVPAGLAALRGGAAGERLPVADDGGSQVTEGDGHGAVRRGSSPWPFSSVILFSSSSGSARRKRC